jgi:N-acetylmuramoyl-L-alanine amidase
MWPSLTRNGPTPPARGAVITTANAPLTNGRALQPGLTLPITGGTAASPEVLTPCLSKVRLKGSGFTTLAPATGNEKIVVVDPGHGGAGAPGAVGPVGVPEAVRNLQVARLVRDELRGSVARVVMTRNTDRIVQLDFRIALADALRASFAISIHFNASPDGPSTHPGTTTFAAAADPNGRRAAGVIFEAERAYFDSLPPIDWVSYEDAGALYRIGSHGDFYRLLRESHVTWVISEALFISNEPEARLLARADIRAGLAKAIATGVMRFLDTDAPGSGWRTPLPRGNPEARPDPPCDEPYV